MGVADVGEPAPNGRRRPGRGYVRCGGTGEDVLLAFPYDADMVRAAKAIGRRRFDWETRTNVYPFARLPQVVRFADIHGIDVQPQVRALMPAADAAARRDGPGGFGQATREAAHLYLRYGLLPVPAWAAGDDGACRCPRGTSCARPGKHPRSVHAGPGPHDYSWKPLACATSEEIEQRFADGGRYAGSNLMVAIPDGMLVIDQDFDDGGRRALDDLAARLGELPSTLGHDTPHGRHRIYRTPSGWTTRAWVGKDPQNPLPAGIDLRVPGQVLMVPPSRVPAGQGMASYGPVAAAAVAGLPAAYVAAWTPPGKQIPAGQGQAAVLPGRADAATAYLNARLTGIAEDLAAVRPGGRNTAIYTAALRVGSTLGAARSLPAGHAVLAWTDEEAENALMVAAEQNGYIPDHSASAARSAIRSGLRNGLSHPRPPPGLTGRHGSLSPASQASRPAAVNARRPEAGQVSGLTGPGASDTGTGPPERRNQAGPGDRRGAISGGARALREAGCQGPADAPGSAGSGDRVVGMTRHYQAGTEARQKEETMPEHQDTSPARPDQTQAGTEATPVRTATEHAWNAHQAAKAAADAARKISMNLDTDAGFSAYLLRSEAEVAYDEYADAWAQEHYSHAELDAIEAKNRAERWDPGWHPSFDQGWDLGWEAGQ